MPVASAGRATRVLATGVLLAGPTALAFFSGGYFASARAAAGIGVWALVAAAAIAGGRRALADRSRASWLAIGGLAGLTAWTLLSLLWAPIAGDAYAAGQIVVLYVGALIGAVLLLRGPAGRWVEPALAAGTVIVIGYGLSERLVPGVLHFARSVSAQGRLQQPLTYWNAMGELAALGFVLCAGLAGNPERPVWQRTIAAAAAAPLGLGLYVSFSRGALFACLAGLVALVVAAGSWEQLRAAVLALVAGLLASVAAAPSAGVTSLAGPLGVREREGAITLALLVVIMLAAAAVERRMAGGRPWAARLPARSPAAGRRLRARLPAAGRLPLPRRAPLIATALICVGLAGAIFVGARETSGSAVLSGGATRLVSLQSNRYDYWDVALRAFATSPLHGVGAGAWSVYWLRWRSVNEFAQNAHSLELETLADLGVVGLALLLTFFGGVALAARRALAVSRGAAGPLAALVVYLVHSPLDWDWQMPAVTLVAVVLAGYLLALAAGSTASDRGVTAPRRSAATPG